MDLDPYFMLRLALGAVFLYVVYQVLRPGRPRFVVTLHGQRVTSRGAIPAWLLPEIEHFLRYDLELAGRVRILGYQEGSLLRLRFQGPLSLPQQQRIRNFLIDRLR